MYLITFYVHVQVLPQEYIDQISNIYMGQSVDVHE